MLFEVKSFLGLAAAIDNLILLGLFVFGGIPTLLGRRSVFGENRIFMWAYSLSAWLILAMTTANLGIALRQRWMFAPMLIFLLISALGPAVVSDYGWDRQGYTLVFAQLGGLLFIMVSQAFQEQVNKNED